MDVRLRESTLNQLLVEMILLSSSLRNVSEILCFQQDIICERNNCKCLCGCLWRPNEEDIEMNQHTLAWCHSNEPKPNKNYYKLDSKSRFYGPYPSIVFMEFLSSGHVTNKQPFEAECALQETEMEKKLSVSCA